MEWLALLADVVYLGLALLGDSFDALLAWVAHDPRAVVKAIGGALGTGLVSALFKGQVTATIYVAGVLGGAAFLVYEWLNSIARNR